MKLGEALTLRARQAQRLNDLQGRIKAAAMVQEGDAPTEDCGALLTDYVDLSAEHASLNEAIGRTNYLTEVEDGKTLASLIQDREKLIRHRNILRLACASASPTSSQYRYMRSEVKLVPQVSVSDLREEEETIQTEANALDAKIQAINWSTDLV